jgi:hypothetical protein
MFRKLAIAVITAWAALLETVADAIAATLPPPAADSPRLRVVAPGRLWGLTNNGTASGVKGLRTGALTPLAVPMWVAPEGPGSCNGLIAVGGTGGGLALLCGLCRWSS